MSLLYRPYKVLGDDLAKLMEAKDFRRRRRVLNEEQRSGAGKKYPCFGKRELLHFLRVSEKTKASSAEWKIIRLST